MSLTRFYNILFLLLLQYNIQAQNNTAKGKVVYQIVSGPSIRTLEMFFNESSYFYGYNNTQDAKNLPTFKNKKYKSLQDSIADQSKIDAINLDIAKAPKQQWFGQMGDDTVTNSAFDNNLKSYCVQDVPGFVHWELQSDTITIEGLKCQKANGKFKGADYIAWFAKDIPVSVAPLQFRGLPGLILKVKNITNNVELSMVELEWPIKGIVNITSCAGTNFVSRDKMKTILEQQNGDALKLIESYKKDLKQVNK